MERFGIGDLIRNKKPYLGESVKLVVDECETQIYVVAGISKYGYFDFPKHREIIFKSQLPFYGKATLREVLFLTVWGWFTRRKNEKLRVNKINK